MGARVFSLDRDAIACRNFFILSFFSLRYFGDRLGGGRGGCRAPPADCERSRQTANKKRLYIISP